MTIPKEMLDCIDEAFNKAEKYEEIKEILNRDCTDIHKFGLIRKLIEEDKQ